MKDKILCLLPLLLLPIQYGEAEDSQQLQICDGALVQVTSISVICDTPITWSYVRGSHRNSATCDYGDFANITVDFDVIDHYSNEIYMELAAYSDQREQLYRSSSKSLCGNYLGSEWSSKGSYTFTKRIQLDYFDGNATGFVPIITMAFSNQASGGKDLGGANIGDCETVDGNSEEDTVDGNSEEDTTLNAQSNQGKAHAFPRYGLIASIFAVALVGLLLSYKYISSKQEAMALLGHENPNTKNEYSMTRTESASTSSSHSKDKNTSEVRKLSDETDLPEGYELMYDKENGSDSSFSM